MSFWKKLFGKKTEKIIVHESTLIELGICPNCWGRQEYEGQFQQFVKDQTKANINHDKAHQKAFIQQFVETNVTGIKLKNEGAVLTCPKCNISAKKIY